MLPQLLLSLLVFIPFSSEWIEQTSHDLVEVSEDSARESEEPVTISQASTTSTNRGMGSDVEQWRPLVAGHFSDLGQNAVDMAMRIMACESGGNTHARNPRSTATGLMQIMASVWGPEYGYSRNDLEVPEINLWVARKVYEIQGWDAWTCWKR